MGFPGPLLLEGLDPSGADDGQVLEIPGVLVVILAWHWGGKRASPSIVWRPPGRSAGGGGKGGWPHHPVADDEDVWYGEAHEIQVQRGRGGDARHWKMAPRDPLFQESRHLEGGRLIALEQRDKLPHGVA